MSRQVLFAVLLLAAAPAVAQKKRAAATGTTTLKKGPPCSSSGYRQFDFWVGEWDVQTPKGTPAGTNVVEKILEGCAIRETWTSSDGSHGSSLTSFDGPANRWTQTFVDDQGLVLVLDGEYRDGRMILSGQRSGPRGGSTLNRIIWQKLDGDRLRQRWEQSPDEGRNWTLLFEGVYTRKKG